MIGSAFMMTGLPILFSILPFLGVTIGTTSYAQPSTPTIYDFKVYLDDDEIGVQRFAVSSEGTRSHIEVEAQFDVTYFLIPFYSYRHTNFESWDGVCLRDIHAKTNDNGESLFVMGAYQDGQLHLQTHAGEASFNGCIKTFAYWNLNLLQSDHLLNSQTGEWQPVKVTKLGKESILVRGIPTDTEHHRIISEKFTIDLWYTPDHEWVALQSTTKTGGKLRYQLQ